MVCTIKKDFSIVPLTDSQYNARSLEHCADRITNPKSETLGAFVGNYSVDRISSGYFDIDFGVYGTSCNIDYFPGQFVPDAYPESAITGADDRSDTLTLDLSGGVPSLPGGILYDGGRRGYDTLAVTSPSSRASRSAPGPKTRWRGL